MPRISRREAIRREFDTYYNSCLLMGAVDENGCISIDAFNVRKTGKNIELFSVTSDIYNYVSNGELIILEYIDIIGENAFERLKIDFIRIPKWIKRVKKCAFRNCINLRKVIIEGNIKEIAPETFSGCQSLQSIILPRDIQRIREEAFSGCISLTEISSLNNLKEIAHLAFYNCMSLQHISLPETMKKMGERVFEKSGLREFTFPKGIETVLEDVKVRVFEFTTSGSPTIASFR